MRGVSSHKRVGKCTFMVSLSVVKIRIWLLSCETILLWDMCGSVPAPSYPERTPENQHNHAVSEFESVLDTSLVVKKWNA